MRSMLRVLVTTAITLLACAEAHATLVKWTLNEVSFDDGGAASGFFVVDTTTGQLAVTYDAETSSFGGFDIKTTDGTKPTPTVPTDGIGRTGETIIMGVEYDPGFNAGGNNDYSIGNHGFHFLAASHSFDFEIWLDTDADLLHATHGTFQVLPGSREEHVDWITEDCGEPYLGVYPGCTASREILPGGTLSATAVPEPSTLVFVALAVGMLLGISRGRSALAVPGTPLHMSS